jgi:trans-2-enoyl-CoA reductase
MGKLYVVAMLEKFRSKACCEWTQYQARNVWMEVRNHLTKQQQLDIMDAWHHSRMDSDKTRKSLHDTVNDVIEQITEGEII